MKGFFTIACGKDEYYQMASNLLKSYKLHNADGAPFAILCDKENEYTKEFDKVVIINNPTKSYLDKITALSIPPYDENIFIDADCLCYRNIQDFWEDIPEQGVSCYGRILDENSEEGWFKKSDLQEKYRELIQYSISLHSGIIMFRDDEMTRKIYLDCLDIIRNYDNNTFNIFKQPADEPVLALSMAINQCYPVENKKSAYLFYPMAKRISCNILKGGLSYMESNGNWVKNVGLIHWQNINIKKPRYISEVIQLNEKSTTKQRVKIAAVYIKDFFNQCKIEYIPWIIYEFDTKILRKK